MEKILVLFDIDGTLLLAQGAGTRAFSRALNLAFGWEDDLPYINFSGSTDLDVLFRVAARHGVTPTPEQVAHFFEVMPVALEETIPGTPSTLFPGVRALLDWLGTRPDVVLGLVTGNVESCARIKLELYELNGHFTLGAYGHEHADRTEIARRAIQRAIERLPDNHQFTRMYLIGDTPSDIQAARNVGAISLAVATGSHPAPELTEAGADHILTDLSDLTRLQAIFALPPLPEP